MENNRIKQIIEVIKEEAHERKMGAAFNGERSDGGASILENQIRFYLLGQKGEVPPEWKKYEHKIDPEYREYMRLKEKFGGK